MTDQADTERVVIEGPGWRVTARRTEVPLWEARRNYWNRKDRDQ